MKTTSFVAALVCCFGLGFASEASANSWRVNYDKRANADFQDLNAAMADERVTDGDTLYMDKRCTISTEQRITKAVTVIGPGYFIGENDADEAYFSNTIYLQAEGVKLTGLHTSTICIQANKSVIERCRITGNIDATETEKNNDNAAIRSCIIMGTITGKGPGGSYAGTYEWEISNNIINSGNNNSYTIKYLSKAVIDHNIIIGYQYRYFSNAIQEVSSSTITNNIIDGRYEYSSVYYDRAIYNFSLSSNNIISHNVLSNPNSTSDYPNNIYGKTYGDVIVCDGNSARDTYYQIKEGSSAKGYAEDSSDCGPFAGAYPYVINGYPLYVPRFESITVPSQPDENGNLNIKMVITNQNK